MAKRKRKAFKTNIRNMRHDNLTTEQAIDILIKEDAIYWTEKGYEDEVDVDWLMVAIFFNSNQIHTFNQGLKTRVFPEIAEPRYVV